MPSNAGPSNAGPSNAGPSNAGPSNAAFGASRDLIEKYAVFGPRYTSYPTAVEFSESFGLDDWREAISMDAVAADGKEPEAGLSFYFHIPFCYTLCYFCACNKVIPKNRDVVGPYMHAMLTELGTYRSLLDSRTPVEQIHWGGGSPDFLSPDEIRKLHATCTDFFTNVVPDADISVELDPRNTSREQLETFSDVGFNRLSFGVQDFNPDVQNLINRVQSFETTRNICDWGRELGFGGINIDLIYGLPNQSLGGFEDTLEKVLVLRPDRIALYGYAHVTWLKKVQKALERAHLPTPEERISLFILALERLTGAGYEYIGMDHFALPSDTLAKARVNGKLNRNFMGYTTHRGARIIGIGASSISSLPSAYAQNQKDVAIYQMEVKNHGLGIHRGVKRSTDDQLRGEIIESILCRGEIHVAEFEAKWNIDFNQTFGASIEKLREFSDDSLLYFEDGNVQLSDRGRLFSRNVAMLFDAYLTKHQEGNKRVFSQAI